MRKLLILSFCLLFSACAGNRTLDGETNKNWIKVVSSKVDNSGTTRDVCFLFDLAFYPGSAYDRIKNNPSACVEECCWYSENKTVEYYFNDGFLRELEDTGVSRRYYPDHIRIKLNYSPFLNRLSARADSNEGITKNGIVVLEYDEVSRIEKGNNESFYRVESKIYPEKSSDSKSKVKGPISYKTISISGINRDELLARAKTERDNYYSQAVAERYVSPEKEYVEESMFFTGQVSPFDDTDKETKWLSKKTLAEEEALRLARYKQNRYTQEEKDKFLQKKKGKNKNNGNDEEALLEDVEYQSLESVSNEAIVESAKNYNAAKDNVLNENGTRGDTSNGQISKKGNVKDSKVKSNTSKGNVSQVSGSDYIAVNGSKNSTNSGKNSKVKESDVMYDVQRTYAQEAKIVYLEPKMPEKINSNTLKKKLAYERTEAVKLLKRFYGDEIDDYIHALDKYKRTEGQVLITNDKIWQAEKIATMIYKIDCNIKGEVILLGADSGTQTADYPIYCGSYIVDLDEKTVEARDDMAKRIAQREY